MPDVGGVVVVPGSGVVDEGVPVHEVSGCIGVQDYPVPVAHERIGDDLVPIAVVLDRDPLVTALDPVAHNQVPLAFEEEYAEEFAGHGVVRYRPVG